MERPGLLLPATAVTMVWQYKRAERRKRAEESRGEHRREDQGDLLLFLGKLIVRIRYCCSAKNLMASAHALDKWRDHSNGAKQHIITENKHV